MTQQHPAPPAGLCASCVNGERTGNTRGSEFLLCALSRTDPNYPRYPRLPVLRCDGHAPRPGAAEGAG